jgi:NAD(P) transhydrogenase subunit alpha
VPEQGLVVGVVRETGPGERRVALTPDGVTRLVGAGLQVLVETGAGAQALFPDELYREAGAEIVSAADLRRRAQLSLRIGPPGEGDLEGLAAGHVLVGMLNPLKNPELAQRLATAGVTAVSLDGLPRTLSRAQAMDVLTSQASVAGYQAVMVAASTYDGFFPMLTTAAGTTRPAAVLVIGAGVAGLQALATARRLGAVVTGSDVREAAKGDVLSTGAKFLDLGSVGASGTGGYARELTAEEKAAQQEALAEAIARFDVVITTAQVPGGRPPLLVDENALSRMAAGSVLVDLACGPLGGNVAGSVPDTTTVTANGVVVVGAGNLPSQMPRAASTSFSRNVCALLMTSLVKDGQLALDDSDEVQAGVVITRDGKVVHPGVLERLSSRTAVA